MGGNIHNLGKEMKVLQGMDQKVKTLEAGNDEAEARKAYDALASELTQINNLHDPLYSYILRQAVKRGDRDPGFKITKDGILEIAPFHMAQAKDK